MESIEWQIQVDNAIIYKKYDRIKYLFKETEDKIYIIRELIRVFITDTIDKESCKNIAYSLAQEMKELSSTDILYLLVKFNVRRYGKKYEANDMMTYLMFETLNKDILLEADGVEIYKELAKFCTEQFMLDHYSEILNIGAHLIPDIPKSKEYKNLISEDV